MSLVFIRKLLADPWLADAHESSAELAAIFLPDCAHVRPWAVIG